MPRSKSIPGSKTSRENINKEQTGAGTPANLPDVKAVTETAPAAVTRETPITRQGGITPEAKTGSQVKVAPEANVASEGRKFEVMKHDSRKNVFPINLEDEIRRRAYELYQQRGSGAGSEGEDWLTAEREIRQRYRQQSA